MTPAKMSAALCRDLFLRYTLPGQVVLDPFFGRGTSLIGCTLGRHVIGVELESAATGGSPFVEYARQNWEYLRTQHRLGTTLGEALIYQGDSRHLPLASAADACVTSPPFGEMLVRDTYQEPANIGLLQHVDCAISSPPYADVASRDRSEEPYCQAQDPELRVKYGTGDVNRHIDGYGHSDGQIGDLAHARVVDACMGSPPFADCLQTQDCDTLTWRRPNGKPVGLGASNCQEYGHSVGQIGALPHAAITSPPYENSARDPGNLDAMRAKLADLYPGHVGPNTIRNATGYGQAEGQVGNDRGETYAAACLAVYRECYRVVRRGGVLVLVTGNYVRDGEIVDLAADTIALAQAAGWTAWERWRHEKSSVSFWRRLHYQQAIREQREPQVVTHEDVLVFCKGPHPAWDFAELPPTTAAPVNLTPARLAPDDAVALALPLLLDDALAPIGEEAHPDG